MLVYAGDLDPSGEDIARDFYQRVAAFGEVVRVAVLPEQIASLGLSPMPGKSTDSRAAGFRTRHGQLVQVEVEAVHPVTLRGLYQEAVDGFWDVSAYAACKATEKREREILKKLAGDLAA